MAYRMLFDRFPLNLLWYGAIYVGVFLVHLFYTVSVDGIYISPDSIAYYNFSRLPLTGSQFWCASRPPVVLLFFKLFGPDYPWNYSLVYSYIPNPVLLYSQTLFSLAAFSFLAFACAKTAQTSKGRLILFAFPLLFSLIPLVARWNRFALSESVAISLFVVFVALWIFCFLTKRLSYFLGIAIVSLLWVGMRDTNAYLLLMIASVILVVIIAHVLKKWAGIAPPKFPPCIFPFTALCIWFGVVFALSNFSADQGDRWLFPFYNSVGQRVLPVPKYVAYFCRHGMPISPSLLERTGKWASDDDSAFYNDPGLEEFRAWTTNHGKMTYIKFLLSHPIYSMTAPALDFQKYFLRKVNTVLDPWISTALSYLLLLSYSLTVCLIPILWWRKYLYKFPYLAVPLVMISLSVPHAWVAYHGDAMEIVRHSLTAVLQFLLGFVLLWLYIWDHSRNKTHRHSLQQAERSTTA